MTNNTHNIWDDFKRQFIGFDAVRKELERTSGTAFQGKFASYPPYNIRKLGDNKYQIELAVAGFAKQDIEIDLEGDKLTITGKMTEDKEDNFIFRGIAARAFTRQFTLNDQVVVKNATMVNGILKIALEHLIPESKKPRKVQITDGDVQPTTKVAQSQYLAEADL